MFDMVVTAVLVAFLAYSIGYFAMKGKGARAKIRSDSAETAFLDELGVERHPRSLDSDYRASMLIMRAALNDSEPKGLGSAFAHANKGGEK